MPSTAPSPDASSRRCSGSSRTPIAPRKRFPSPARRPWSPGRLRGCAPTPARRSRRDVGLAEVAERLANASARPADVDDEHVEDDRLRLIFACCHPALAADAQVALTLREVCGLPTEAIARAFLTPAPTLAQRIV